MATADLMLGEWLPDIDLVFKVRPDLPVWSISSHLDSIQSLISP